MCNKEKMQEIIKLINEIINDEAPKVDGTNEHAVRSLNIKYSIRNAALTVQKIDNNTGTCTCGNCD